MSSSALPQSPAPPKLLFVYPNKIFGQKYTVVKAPTFSTIVQKSPSGASTRIGQRRNPVWEFTLTYEQLFNDLTNPAYGDTELNTLMGFYMLQQGQLGEFLFDDPEDDLVTNQALQLVSDSSNSPVLAAAIGASAGSGFTVGDQLGVAGGGGSGAVLQVSSVSGGAITGLTVAAGGAGYVTTTGAALTVLTGSGTGSPTANISAMPQWFSPLQRQLFSALEDITDLNPNVAFTVNVNGSTPPSGSYALSAAPGLSVSGGSFAGLYLRWTQWQPGIAVAAGALLIDPAGHLQKITTPGNLGTAPPTFNDSGSTTADGTAAWTDQGAPRITASFGFYFRVRFAEDSQDFEKFLQHLYTIGGAEGRLGKGSVKLESVRPPLDGSDSGVNMTIPTSVTDGTTRPGQRMAILFPAHPFAVGSIDSHILDNTLIINLPGGGGTSGEMGPGGIGLFRGGNSSSLDTPSDVEGQVNIYQLPPGVQASQVTEVWAVIGASKLNQQNAADISYHANFGLPTDDTVNQSAFGDILETDLVGSLPYSTFDEYNHVVDARKVAPVAGAGGYPTNAGASRWNSASDAAAALFSFSFAASLNATLWQDLQVFWGGNMPVIIWYTP